MLRKTHKLRLLLGTSHASDEGTSEAREAQGLQELGCSKVVTIRLHGLDPATSVRLLLRRVHRPLEPHDLFPLEALSEGRARAQLRENREVAKLNPTAGLSNCRGRCSFEGRPAGHALEPS